MAVVFNDPMRNHIKDDWTVLNEQPAAGPENQIVYSHEGVEMLNNEFDILNTDYHFALRLDLAAQNATWEIDWLPGALAFGYMEVFLHTSATDDPNNVTDGPWGFTQHWSNDALPNGKSHLYFQHGSSNPIEDTKMLIQPEEWIHLRLRADATSGKIVAEAQADSWGKHYIYFGESSQDTFEDTNLYLCIANKKSWATGNLGWNTWRNVKITT